jgi:phage terminase large subunit-like protein
LGTGTSEDWRTHPLGQKAVEFFERLTLIGDYYGRRWKLEPQQDELVRRFYGTRLPDGSRQYNKLSIWEPRGRGKSQKAAGFGAYQFFCGPPGQEIYAASSDREKAKRIYTAMSTAIHADKSLNRLAECSDYNLRIRHRRNGTVFQALAADSDQGHSLSPSMLIADEVHLWYGTKGRKLYDALTSGFQKRKSRLEIQISTAGDNRQSLAWDLYSYARNVRDGVIKDPRTLVHIAEVPESEDWRDPEVWQRYVPCSFVNWDEVREECRLAQIIRYKEYSFRQLYLNQWIEHQAESWVKPSEWRACQDDYTPEDLYGQRCTAALDLSSVRDLTALTLYCPDTHRTLSWCWLPGDGIFDREERDQVTYRRWADDGHLYLTTGGRIVHSEVAEKVNEILMNYDVVRLVADPYSLHLIAPYLNQEPERYPQSPGYMSPPTKWLETAISTRAIKHNGNPLLAWCVGNVVVEKDKYENVTPVKGKSRNRIDAAVALVMAVGAWIGGEGAQSEDLSRFCANRDNLLI